MITEERVMKLLARANPEPEQDFDLDADAAAYLATLQRRSSEVTQLETRPKKEHRPQRLNRLIAVAVVSMVIIGTGVFVLTRASQEAPVATTPTTAPTAVTEPEVAAVMAAIDAYNSGDIDAWLAAFAPDSTDRASWAYEGETRYLDEVLMNANSRLTVVEPCRPTVPEVLVECQLAYDDDWAGPAGFTYEAEAQFWLDDQLRITTFSDQIHPLDEEASYPVAFWDWLRTAHPDVSTAIEPRDTTFIPGFEQDPDDMTVAIQHVDEFIAQSDAYPIDSNE